MPNVLTTDRSRQYHAHDLWQQRGFEKGLVYSGNVLRDGDLVDENVFQHSKIYVEFLSKLNIGRILSGMIFTEADSAPFRGEQHPIVVSLFREFDRPFCEEAVSAIRLLIPHLSRALSVMFRLRDFDLRISASQATLDLLPTAIVLSGGEGEVVFANQAARAILQENAGLRLRTSAQCPDTFHLCVPHGSDQRRLDGALRELLAPQGTSPRFSRVISLTDTASLTLNLSILPETRQFGIGTHIPRAIGFLNASAQDVRLDREMLVSAYGLTGAEIRTAELILNGHSTDDAAKSLNLSVNTIKTQVNKIFEKTGTNSRSRLVKMLLYLSICSPVPAAAATPPHAASTPARRPGESTLPLPRRQPAPIAGEALAE